MVMRWLRRIAAVIGALLVAVVVAVIVLEKTSDIDIVLFPGDESNEVAPQNLLDAAPEKLFPELKARGYVCSPQTPVPARACETQADRPRREIVVRMGVLFNRGIPSEASAHLALPASAADIEHWAADAALIVPKDEREELEEWLREHGHSAGETATHSAEVQVTLAADGIRADISARGSETASEVIFRDRTRWPGAEAAKELAPTLIFDAKEQFFPVSIDAYLANTQLCTVTIKHQLIQRRRIRLGDRVRNHECKPAPPLHGLPEQDEEPNCPSNDHDLCYWALDIPQAKETGDIEAYKHAQTQMRSHDKGRHTVYWNYVDDTKRDESVLQYWFFYPFNNFGNAHEGDWEAIVLETHSVLGAYLLPLRAAYSSHDGGRSTKPFARQPNGRAAGSVVYVAAGSHANYLEPGRSTVTVCDKGRKACVTSPEHACGDGKTLKPSDYDLRPLPETPAFWGSYGGANYVSGIARVPDARPISDPRIRPDWAKDPLAMFRRATTDPQPVSPC